FSRALAQTEADPAMERLLEYAQGMHAYIERDYASSIRHLAVWAESSPLEPDLAALARDAVSSVVQLAEGGDRMQIAGEASALLGRLGGPAAGFRRRTGAASSRIKR